MTDDERCRLRVIAMRVCERWGNELKSDPSAFIPITERPHSSFTDEECCAILAAQIKHQDEYAIDGVERESVDPFVFPPIEDEEFPVPGSVIWGLLCINRDSLSTPETLQRGKSWLQKRVDSTEEATGDSSESEAPKNDEDGNSRVADYSSLTPSQARDTLGKLLVERFDLKDINNLDLQNEANKLITELGLRLTPYDSDTGNGVADLYKRSFKKLHGQLVRVDRRGKNKEKPK